MMSVIVILTILTRKYGISQSIFFVPMIKYTQIYTYRDFYMKQRHTCKFIQLVFQHVHCTLYTWTWSWQRQILCHLTRYKINAIVLNETATVFLCFGCYSSLNSLFKSSIATFWTLLSCDILGIYIVHVYLIFFCFVSLLLCFLSRSRALICALFHASPIFVIVISSVFTYSFVIFQVYFIHIKRNNWTKQTRTLRNVNDSMLRTSRTSSFIFRAFSSFWIIISCICSKMKRWKDNTHRNREKNTTKNKIDINTIRSIRYFHLYDEEIIRIFQRAKQIESFDISNIRTLWFKTCILLFVSLKRPPK